MKKILIVTIAAMIMATGCSKDKGTEVSPSPSAVATPAVTGSPSPAASPSPSVNPAVSPGTETNTPKPSVAPTPAPESLSSLTKKQDEQLDYKSKLDDLIKMVGKDIKPISEESGKKTYEFKLSDEANTFVIITYFSDGTFYEKKVYKR
ncbi:hypothetical protein D3C73_489560 [compost metagenome]